jgi:HlyD family secretion protein
MSVPQSVLRALISRRGIAVMLWLGAVIGVVNWIISSAPPEEMRSAQASALGQAQKSTGGNDQRSIVARGRIEPQSRVRIVQSPEKTVIQAVTVKEGDIVTTGTVLAEMSNLPILKAKLDLEERRLDEARQQATQVRAPAKVAALASQRAIVLQREAEAQRTRNDYERAVQLRQNSVVSEQTFETRRSQMVSAARALDEARSTLTALSETRSVDAIVADAKIEVQRASVSYARAEYERSIIKAPINGTILTISARAGETPGDDGVLQMADLGALIVVAEVDEADTPRLAVGQNAMIRSSLISGVIEGKVTRVTPSLFKQKRPTSDIVLGRDARIAEVEISAVGPLPTLVGGEVTVEILAR